MENDTPNKQSVKNKGVMVYSQEFTLTAEQVAVMVKWLEKELLLQQSTTNNDN